MSEIPAPSDSTVKRIYESYERNAKPRFSRRLGASQIGRPCERECWYSFRWAKQQKWEGRMLRLFLKGTWEETIIAEDLKAIGADFRPLDPDTGEQWEFDGVDGHLVAKLDGIVQGIPESSKWHSCEFKTANDKAFNAVQKDGCQKAKPEHYAQCMVGMELAGLERCLYLVVNKNTEDIYTERIHFDKKEFANIIQKAKSIIYAETAPERISESPAWYQCSWCNFKSICHDCGGWAEKNCRTCVHSTPIEDAGQWGCNKHDKTIDADTQKAGCSDHEFRPEMISTTVTKALDVFGGKLTVDAENLSV